MSRKPRGDSFVLYTSSHIGRVRSPRYEFIIHGIISPSPLTEPRGLFRRHLPDSRWALFPVGGNREASTILSIVIVEMAKRSQNPFTARHPDSSRDNPDSTDSGRAPMAIVWTRLPSVCGLVGTCFERSRDTSAARAEGHALAVLTK